MSITRIAWPLVFVFFALFGCTEDTVDFTLTVGTTGNGSVLREKLDDNTWKLTAQPQDNFEFLNWSGDISSTDNPIEITLDENKQVTANFEADELLKVQASEGGSFELNLLSTDNGVFVYELIAIPAMGYEFVKWNKGATEYFTKNLTLEIEEETQVILDFTDPSQPFRYDQTPIVDLGSEVIWGLDAIDNDHLIFTTKSGRIFTYRGNQAIEISAHYRDIVNSSGQGGLLDIRLDPDYETNKYVYVTYSEKIPGSNFSYLALDRFEYDNGQISGIETLFKSGTPSQRAGHFGSRISFSHEHLYLSIGEGSPSLGGADSPRRNAQELGNDWGKIHRLNPDGSVPEDNPFYGDANSRETIFSYGHRNPQGLLFDPYESSILSTEHGPKGGDELNRIEKGLNYGWPIVSYGINYNGSDISGRSHAGYEEPLFYWDPSIATSNAILLKDKNHNSWFRNILVAGLRSNSIHRLKSQNGVYEQAESIRMGFRVRAIAEAENGVFFVSSDSGIIVKFTPLD